MRRLGHANPEVVVALDAMGVIYQPGADVDELLIPFARERGCARADSEIIELYNDTSRGLLSTRELWEHLGVAGEPGLLDREAVDRYSLTGGLHEFLRWCDDAGISVACISNDISEWAVLRARRFGLSDAIATWTISGDVGHRKPQEAIYDAFLAIAPADAACIFVDDRPENVAAAVSRGMRGVLFSPSPVSPQPGIACASDFASLKKLVTGMRKAGGR